jgi:hypothetical protein
MKRSLEDSPPSKRQRAEETKESTKADLHVLSDHVILKYIFSFFTSPRELVNLSLVHREWNATVENDKELLLVRTNKWYKMNGLWGGEVTWPLHKCHHNRSPGSFIYNSPLRDLVRFLLCSLLIFSGYVSGYGYQVVGSSLHDLVDNNYAKVLLQKMKLSGKTCSRTTEFRGNFSESF